MNKFVKFAAACAAVLCAFGAMAASLPEGYQAVEYVDSTGTQWFDTGIVVNENHEFRFKYAILSCKEYRGPFGSYVSESANATRIMVNNGSKTGAADQFHDQGQRRFHLVRERDNRRGRSGRGLDELYPRQVE